MAERTCTRDDCTAELYAKSLCQRHYKQTRPRTPDVLETVACDGCGENYQRPKRKQRYASSFCSYLCRDYARWGALSSDLPAEHWALVWGTTCEWTPPKPRPARFTAGRCGECDTLFVSETNGSPIEFCSIQCKRKVAKRNRRARECGAPGEYRYVEIIRQYRRQGRVCAYCEQPCAGLPEPEHVVALSRGGRNDMTNLVAACTDCNRDKSDMTLDEWKLDRARRGLQPVHTHLVGEAYTHLMPSLNAPTGTAYRHRDAA